MQYAQAGVDDANDIAALAILLWPDNDPEQLERQFRDDLLRGDGAVFLCRDGATAVGFAQFSLRRDYVEGTCGSPVGYLEGVYVSEQNRRAGIAQALVRCGEAWAKEQGCRQMASDCELDNTGSLAFHLGCGFSEANRIICFVKNIADSAANTFVDEEQP